MKYFLIFLIKKRLNRLIFNPFETITLILIVLLAIALPYLLFGIPNTARQAINIIRLQLMMNVYCIFLARIFFQASSRKTVKIIQKLLPNNVLTVFDLIPHRMWCLIFLNQLDNLLKISFFCCSFCILPGIIFGLSAAKIIGGTLVMFVFSVFIVLISSVFPAFFALSMIKKNGVLIIMRLLALIFLIGGISGIFFKENILNFNFSPQSVMAKATMTIIYMFGGIKDWLTINILFELLIYIFITIILCRILFPRNLSSVEVYESKNFKLAMGKKFSFFLKCLFFLPKSLKYLVSRELVQILIERTQLFGMIFQTLLMVAIMLGASALIDSKLILLGLIISIAHPAFSIGLSSLPRESNGLWIIKVCFPRFTEISIAKFISCLICSWIMGIIISAVYCILILLFMRNQVGVNELIITILWGLLITQPAALGMGFLLSSIIPFKGQDFDSDIKYSFFGLDGILFLIQVWFLSLPAALASGLLGVNQSILKYLFYIYTGSIIFIGLNSAIKRLQKED
ncbi:MAG: hypothetical protein K6U80_05400 [Firmicutes bacterium]|nr:hypothetical protein [Bacillota bacterium]